MDVRSWGRGALIHTAAACTLLAAALFLYYNSSRFLDVMDGFIICKGDCSNFDRYSDYIVAENDLPPADANFHSSVFYRGYILAVALIKSVFGDGWELAYTGLSLTSLFALIIYAARSLAPRAPYWPKFAVGFLLVLTNLNFFTFARTLLSDLPFSVGAGFFFVTLVSGLERGSPLRIATAMLVSLGLCFVRTSGVFLVILAMAAVAPYYVPPLRRRSLDVVAPVIAGLMVFVAVAVVSQILVSTWDQLNGMSPFFRGIALEILEVNYFGEDNLSPPERWGAIIVESREWSMNDGTALQIAGAFGERAAKIFEVAIDGYSFRNNAYRVLFYGCLYAALVVFVAAAWRERGERLRYLLLCAGYVLIFVTVSHVPVRYRLTFDILWTVAAMSSAAWLSSFMGSRRSSMPTRG